MKRFNLSETRESTLEKEKAEKLKLFVLIIHSIFELIISIWVLTLLISMHKLIKNAVKRKRTSSKIIFDPRQFKLSKNINIQYPGTFDDLNSSRDLTRKSLGVKRDHKSRKSYLNNARRVQPEIDPYVDFEDAINEINASKLDRIQNPFISGIKFSALKESGIRNVPTLPNLNSFANSRKQSIRVGKQGVFVFSVKDIVEQTDKAKLFESQMFAHKQNLENQETARLNQEPELDFAGNKIWEEFYKEEHPKHMKRNTWGYGNFGRMSIQSNFKRKSFKEDLIIDTNNLDPLKNPEMFKTPVKVRVKSKTFKYDIDKWNQSDEDLEKSNQIKLFLLTL